ncbi:uncharacterized protein LOC141620877 [Silene latifolia]|uniref:uncharacterized protein LOC141620877 n=1 Tax=Silene latifolia TaxID=37657 RepID=UPI003D772D12
MAVGMGLKDLDIYGDSELVINQLTDEYKVKKENLIPLHNLARLLLERLDSIILEHVPRSDNKMADALANLAATLALEANIPSPVPICEWVVSLKDHKSMEEFNAIFVHEIDKEDWRQPIIERSFNELWPRCLDEEKGLQAMEEAHAGVCGAHQSGPKLCDRIKRMGYYWPTMVNDYMKYARRCDACQFHGTFIHSPPEPLHLTVTSWPFEAWSLDVVGPIIPKSSAGHAYILAGTDYFSKWAEVVVLKEVKKENVADFIRNYIIYCYGIPKFITTDNANGLAEAFNKTLSNLLKKVVSKNKLDWHERLGEAMWAYRTTCRTATQATPYALVYGVEVVLPLELEIPSLHIAMQMELTEEENDKLRLAELETLDEKRLDAQQKLECYHARMSRAFNKKVRPRAFQVGDLVLAVRRPIITTHKTGNKFTSK